MQPLMRVLMVHVCDVAARVQDPITGVIAHVAVIDVGRIVGVIGLGRLRPARDDHVVRPHRVSREVDHHRRVAIWPGTEEELFILAGGTVRHRPRLDPVGPDRRADCRHAVVDREEIAAALQCLVHRVAGILELLERLLGDEVVMVVNDDLAIGLPAVRIGRVVPEVGACFVTRKAPGVRSGDDRGEVAVIDPLRAALDRSALAVARLVFHVQRLEHRCAGA